MSLLGWRFSAFLMVPYGFSYLRAVSYENPASGNRSGSPDLQGSGIPMSDYSIGFRDSFRQDSLQGQRMYGRKTRSRRLH